tara:strand:- start:72 stop:413 length:342 start_codon:yes stop_codon:yes gene_type:complete
MLENTAKQCIPSLELGDLSERKMQAVSRIPAVFLTTKNSHKVEPKGLEPRTVCLEGKCSIQLSYGIFFAICPKEQMARSCKTLGYAGVLHRILPEFRNNSDGEWPLNKMKELA